MSGRRDRIHRVNLEAWKSKEGGWGRGIAATLLLIALAGVDRGLSGLWPVSYGLYTRWRRSPR